MKKIFTALFAALCISGFAAEEIATMQDGWKILSKDNVKAEKIFRAVAKNAKNNVERGTAVIGISFALRYQRKNAEVIKEIDSFCASAPDISNNVRAHLTLFKGNALRDLNRTSEALETYKSGWELNSSTHYSLDCAKEYIWLAADRKLNDDAWKMYEISSKHPSALKNPGYLTSCAWAMWKLNKADEGMKLLDAAEKLKLTDGQKEVLHRHRGYIQRALLKDYNGAVKSFETALELAANDFQKATLWNNIGMTFEAAKEYGKALEAYKKVGTFNAKGWFVKSAEMSAKRMEEKITPAK